MRRNRGTQSFALLVLSLFLFEEKSVAFSNKGLTRAAVELAKTHPSHQPHNLVVDSSSFELAAVSSDLSFSNPDVLVFIAGLIPFGWATVEFWRRIAVGEPFGTGSDSIFIGKDNAPKQSRGRQTLDRGAFIVAYILFTLAGGSIALTLYSVISSAPPAPEDLAAAASVASQL